MIHLTNEAIQVKSTFFALFKKLLILIDKGSFGKFE